MSDRLRKSVLWSAVYLLAAPIAVAVTFSIFASNEQPTGCLFCESDRAEWQFFAWAIPTYLGFPALVIVLGLARVLRRTPGLRRLPAPAYGGLCSLVSLSLVVLTWYVVVHLLDW